MATELNQKDESLQRLVDFFSLKDSDVDFSYNELRESLIAFFRLKGDTDPETAMDLTLDRVADKVTQGVEIEDLKKYSIAVARFIFLERMTCIKREHRAAAEFYSNKIAEQTENDEPDRQMQARRDCFEILADEEKCLLRNYFAELPFSKLNERRFQICAENKISLNNLRLKIFRLRQRLEKCAKNKLK